MGLRTFTPVGGLLWYKCSPVCVTYPAVMGFDFIVIAPLLPSHCGFSFVFGRGVFFGEFQCLPVDDSSAVSCDSGALTRGSEPTSFYSAILLSVPLFCFKMSVSSPVKWC